MRRPLGNCRSPGHGGRQLPEVYPHLNCAQSAGWRTCLRLAHEISFLLDMKLIRFFSLPVVALLAIATAAFAQEVKTDYDHHANFSQYHAYYWEKIKTSAPLWQSRIQDAVDHELQAKGWRRVESGGDIAVTAVGSARNQQEYTTFYKGMGGGRWGGFGETTTQVENYPVGSLVLNLYDTQNKVDLARRRPGISFG